MTEIIYMTTYLEQHASKPSVFQRNMAEKARFQTRKKLSNYKKNKLKNTTITEEFRIRSVTQKNQPVPYPVSTICTNSLGFGCLQLGTVDIPLPDASIFLMCFHKF